MIKNLLQTAGKTLSKNSSVLLTVTATAGTITTALFTAKAVLKAETIILQKEEELETYLTLKEKFKETWKVLLPPTICCIATCTSIIFLNSIHSRRTAALAGLLTITKNSYDEYKDSVAEIVNKKQVTAIKDKMCEKAVSRNDIAWQEQPFLIGEDEVLCYDMLSDRYFKSTIETIKQAVNELNRRLMTEHTISLNEYYYEIKQKPLEKVGNILGWNIDTGLIEPYFSSVLMDNKKPCLAVDFDLQQLY